ncbi:MAG: hypothetical protein M5R36_10950 [Deltaproteobacteria bacterium]|nr:hypothetical protein [Deltaproteobacteria bacterium]
MIRAALILAVFAFSTILACGGDDDDDSGAGDDGDTAPDDDDGDDDTDAFVPGSGCRMPDEESLPGFVGGTAMPGEMLCCREWYWALSGDECVKLEGNGTRVTSCGIIESLAECAACEIEYHPESNDAYCP